MAIYKEWLVPFASAVIRNAIAGPVYMLGDQECFFSSEYGAKRLRKAGPLRNPNARVELRDGLVTARSVFRMLGVEPYFDIDLNEHADYRLDLSQPLPPKFRGVAQSVIDIGTTEHIFDAAQVFKNMVEMLRPGGVVMHLSPVSWHNHGFYNFNPVLFNEFYAANGFARLQHGLLLSPVQYPLYTIATMLSIDSSWTRGRFGTPSALLDDERYWFDVLARNVGILARAIFLFVARKPPIEQPVVFPVQRLYAASIAQAAGSAAEPPTDNR